MIELTKISKVYKNKQQVLETKALNDVSLRFSNEEFVSIVGPSGCGKTTLLNLIGGLDKPTNGKIFFENKDISTWNSRDFDIYRNEKIGFVFQNYLLLEHLSVFENVAIKCRLQGIFPEKCKELVMSVLEKVGMAEKAHCFPSQLSGGQKQRAAIARAIVNSPSIILADEPTGALDSSCSMEIMELLKELSNTCLVIMVTHNQELAKKYSTRIIHMLDGNINREECLQEKKKSYDVKKEFHKHVSLPLKESLRLSVYHMMKKKFRTLLVVIAGAIGLIAIGMIGSLASGVDVYLMDAQTKSMMNYPITVYSSAAGKSNENTNITENFPTSDSIFVRVGETTRTNLSYMDEEAITYIENISPSLVTAINYNRSVSAKLITHVKENQYMSVSNYMYELSDNQDYIESQYDCLYGHFPNNKNEMVLYLDSYNAISASTLDSLGIDYTSKSSYTFSDFIDKEYRYCSNDKYYTYKEIYDIYDNSYKTYKEAYDDSDFAIKIVGIVRMKRNSTLSFYTNPGILYSKELTDYVLNDSNQSEIVIKQKQFGLEKNVFTGEPFEDRITSTSTIKASYQYQVNLLNLGAIAQVSNIKIYTSDYDSRTQVKNYLDAYLDRTTEEKEETFVLTIYDFLGLEAEEIGSFFHLITEVLFLFGCVSLLVSSILIAIITYISTMERTKEIGILRSLGARKIDISFMFHFENIIIGFCSGIIAVVGVIISIHPINSHMNSIIATYGYDFMLSSTVSIASFQPLAYIAIILLGMGISLLAGCIPAYFASKQNPVNITKAD